MFPQKFALSALTLEAAAWAAGLRGESADLMLLGYLGAHAGASICLAVVVMALLPARCCRPRWPVILLLFGVGFAVPVLGFAGLVLLAVFLRRRDIQSSESAFRGLELPAIDPHQRPGMGFRQSGLGAFLANPKAPEATRLRALVALQYVPGHLASPLLRSVLADPSEDIRLLAYGILDQRERRLNELIHQEREQYAAAADADVRAATARRLGDLYWELIYQGLVQGDLRKHALQASLDYSLETLRVDRRDAAMYLRIGRLRQMLGEPQAAREAYETSLLLGMPRSRVVPYLAELDFERREFASARGRMAELSGWDSLPRLQPTVRYWSQP